MYFRWVGFPKESSQRYKQQREVCVFDQNVLQGSWAGGSITLWRESATGNASQRIGLSCQHLFCSWINSSANFTLGYTDNRNPLVQGGHKISKQNVMTAWDCIVKTCRWYRRCHWRPGPFEERHPPVTKTAFHWLLPHFLVYCLPTLSHSF